MRYSRNESEFDRAIAFMDATFALALTLLVTTLDVSGTPAASWEGLSALGDEVGAQFIAFAIAFYVISGYWLGHHRMVASFTGITTRLIVANLFLLAAIILLPFSTEAVGDPEIDHLPLPTALLALNVAAASVLMALVRWLAWREDLLRARPSPAEFRNDLGANMVPAAVFLASIPLAYLVSPDAAQLSWLSMVPLSVLAGRRAGSSSETG